MDTIPLAQAGRYSDDPLTLAFAEKTSAVAGLRPQPVAPAESASLWARLAAEPPGAGKRLVYVHIPFCKTQCSYCGFYQNTTRAQHVAAYVARLLLELERARGLAACEAPFHAIYVGGGTPTDLTEAQIIQLGEAFHRYLPMCGDCEITFESRFSGLSDVKIQAVFDAGFNRVSLGVQTFDTTLRRRMSRIDDQAYLLDRLQRLAEADRAAIVIDLLYGLPWQTLEDWQRDLSTLLALPLDGADLYQLLLLPHTRMGKAVAAGGMPSPADTALKAQMFRAGVELLQQNHVSRLSVSHWGCTTRERNIYNHYAKAGTHMVPFGCGAGGRVQGHGVMLHRALPAYLAAVDAGQKPVVAMTRPHPAYRVHGVIAEGFDSGYLNLHDIQRRSGIDLAADAGPLLAAWERNGLVSRHAGFVTLTLAGQFWQVNLQQGLLDYLEEKTHHESDGGH